MAKEASFGKEEKLKSRKAVEELFAKGKNQNIFPIRVSYRFLPASTDEKPGLKIGVSVGRKNFKKAVDRNRIKRLLKETYRLQKKELVQAAKEKQSMGFIFFIYTDKVLPDYKTMFEAMSKCLEFLKRKMKVEKPS